MFSLVPPPKCPKKGCAHTYQASTNGAQPNNQHTVMRAALEFTIEGI